MGAFVCFIAEIFGYHAATGTEVVDNFRRMLAWIWNEEYVPARTQSPAFRRSVFVRRAGTGLSLNYGQRVVRAAWATITAAVLIDRAQSFGLLTSSAH